MTMTPEAMLAAAMEGTLDLDADASQATAVSAPAADTTTTTTTAAPEAGTAQAAAAAGAGVTTAQDDEPAGAPIASKTGGYTIPFQKLTDARAERDEQRARGDQLAADNARLQEQLQQLTQAQQQNLAQATADAASRADAGAAQTQADKNLALAQAAAAQGVDMAVFGDFSEEGIAKGVAALVQQLGSQMQQQVQAQVAQALAPVQQREQLSAEQSHAQAIYGAHPDADEIAESAEFGNWLNGQPGFARAAVQQVLQAGTAAQVVEVLNTFKQSQGAPKTPDPVDAAVQRAKENAQQHVPISLSDLTGAAAGTSDAERMQALAGNPAALLGAMEGLSPDKLDELMNRLA